MRSVAALVALALSGTLDIAAASHCKPRPSHISSATTDLIPSDTATSAAASGTAGSVVIKSVIDGGGFSIAPPEGGIPGFTASGDATIVVGPGYKGDGSKDSGCLSLQASGDKKRDLGSFAGVAQLLELLSLTRPYTVRFFYFVVTAPSLNFCQLTASLGGQTFFQTWIISFGTSVQWGMALEQVTAAQRSAPLSISMNCLVGGSAQVYVDSLFMSNQVTPATIDDHPLDLGDGDVSDFTTTSSPAVQTTTSSKVGTTSLPPIIPTHTQSSDSYSNSATPGTGSPNTQSTGNHTPATGPPTPGGNTPAARTSTAWSETQTGSQTPGARTTTSSSRPAPSQSATSKPTTSGGSSSPNVSPSTIKGRWSCQPRCANVGAYILFTSRAADAACSAYNSLAGAYSRFTSSNYQKDCAALCRLMRTVLSGATVGNCANEFIASVLSCILSKHCPSFTDDRSCIISMGDPPSKDSICINKMGDTPNKGSDTPTIQQPRTTPAESTSSTATIFTCPIGIAAPNHYHKSASLPTHDLPHPGIAAHWLLSQKLDEPPVHPSRNSIPGILDHWWGQSDNDVEPQSSMEEPALRCQEQGGCGDFGIQETDHHGVCPSMSTYEQGTEAFGLDNTDSFKSRELCSVDL
ncbi:hypothetical protein CEK25_010431 [Fusarium fujikuroi]|nr:hypothetical protein CEK25_010431 [Fusarium fujikuroi]